MPHTHLPWHDEPQLHSTKATAAHDHFQQHFTTFTRWVPLATELSIPVEQLGGGLKKGMANSGVMQNSKPN